MSSDLTQYRFLPVGLPICSSLNELAPVVATLPESQLRATILDYRIEMNYTL